MPDLNHSAAVNETPEAVSEVKGTEKPTVKTPKAKKTPKATQEKTPKTSIKKDKTMKTEKKATKTAPKAKAAVKKVAKSNKPKKDRAKAIPFEEGQNKILKFIAKSTKPVKKDQISTATGLSMVWGINYATANAPSDKDDPNKSLVAKGFVKREAAKFHDLGMGYVFTITTKGRAAAAKL